MMPAAVHRLPSTRLPRTALRWVRAASRSGGARRGTPGEPAAIRRRPAEGSQSSQHRPSITTPSAPRSGRQTWESGSPGEDADADERADVGDHREPRPLGPVVLGASEACLPWPAASAAGSAGRPRSRPTTAAGRGCRWCAASRCLERRRGSPSHRTQGSAPAAVCTLTRRRPTSQATRSGVLLAEAAAGSARPARPREPSGCETITWVDTGQCGPTDGRSPPRPSGSTGRSASLLELAGQAVEEGVDLAGVR